jgi:hypothetical protein
MWGSGPGGHLEIGGIFSEPWGKAEGENVDMDEKSNEKERELCRSIASIRQIISQPRRQVAYIYMVTSSDRQTADGANVSFIKCSPNSRAEN